MTLYVHGHERVQSQTWTEVRKSSLNYLSVYLQCPGEDLIRMKEQVLWIAVGQWWSKAMAYAGCWPGRVKVQLTTRLEAPQVTFNCLQIRNCILGVIQVDPTGAVEDQFAQALENFVKP